MERETLREKKRYWRQKTIKSHNVTENLVIFSETLSQSCLLGIIEIAKGEAKGSKGIKNSQLLHSRN